MNRFIPFVWLFCSLAAGSVSAQDAQPYQRPPQAIADLIEAPATPGVVFDSKGRHMLILERAGYPGIEDVAQPEVRVGGLRFNPVTSWPGGGSTSIGLKVKNLLSGQTSDVSGLPAKPKIAGLAWSPDESKVAFVHIGEQGIETWLLDIATLQARRLSDRPLNMAAGLSITWLPDGSGLIVPLADPARGQAPIAPAAPTGPNVQENLGKAAPSRTYQDLIKNPYDEQLFAWHLSTALAKLSLDGAVQTLGIHGLIRDFSLSPDGRYLLTERIQKPFSYLVPYYSFPYRVEISDRSTGQVVKLLADLPAAENVPIDFDAVPAGPREAAWRLDAPATVVWAEALDGGNPKTQTAERDAVYQLAAPFTATPTLMAKTGYRFDGIVWGDGNHALLSERWWKTRQEKRWLIRPDQPAQAPTLLIERSSEDVYNDPGSPVLVRNSYGRSVLLLQRNKKSVSLLMTGEGGSPDGSMPFLSRFDLNTRQTAILWRCAAPYYEYVAEVLDPQGTRVITRRESEKDVPNYYLRDLTKKTETPLTAFPHPAPGLEGISKEVVNYKRADGLPLTATLYLPKGYKPEDGRLPVLMWAYPREYKSAQAAGQVRGSKYTFSARINWGSPLYWVTQGYAVLDRTEMPIVGEGEAQPNDTFIEQLRANAKAAIQYLTEKGICDPRRVAVGGHSYGAFMTANLLAHTDLFAAGIARSGAYNRTLTPFGFQQEERSYWEAPQIYYQMSPFSYAHQIKTPLLLIHGEADNNPGTFPIQSERLYNAIKGHGGTSRLVMLPHESHGYRAKESVLHMLWEMNRWLDKYVKNREQ